MIGTGRLRRGVAISASACLVTAGMALTTPAVGAPSTDTVVWAEDFQVQDTSVGNAASRLGDLGYSAGDTWQAGQGNCNGWVLNYNSASPGDGCDGGGGIDANGTTRTSYWYGQRLATVLGIMDGMTGAIDAADSPTQNSAVLALTNGGATSPQLPGVQFEANNVVQAVPGHSYAVAANFSEVHCPGDPMATASWTAASETLYLVVDGAPQPAAGDGTLAGGVSVCADPSSTTMTPTSAETGVDDWGGMVFHDLSLVSSPVLVTSAAQLGLQIFNAQGQPAGNDLAFDDLQIIDVTPPPPPPPNPGLLLEQAADPSTVTSTADVVQYQFTITNTGDVAISSIGVYEAPDSAGNTGTGTMTTITCPQTTLAAGESTTCTASYTPSQVDIDAGSWTNVALAIGQADGVSAPTLSSLSTLSVDVAQGGSGNDQAGDGTGGSSDQGGGTQGGSGDGSAGDQNGSTGDQNGSTGDQNGGQTGDQNGGQSDGQPDGSGQGGSDGQSGASNGSSDQNGSSGGQGDSSTLGSSFSVWVDTGGVLAPGQPSGGTQSEAKAGIAVGVMDRRRRHDGSPVA